MANTRKKQVSRAVLKNQAFDAIFSEPMWNNVMTWLRNLAVPSRNRVEVGQEVFLSAFQSFHTFNPYVARPERWMNVVTVYGASHITNKPRRRHEVLMADAYEDSEEPEALDALPDEVAFKQEMNGLVWEVIQAIDDPHLRILLVCHGIYDIPMVELADQWQMPSSTIYKVRNRAFEAFRVEARRRGIRFAEDMMLPPFDNDALTDSIQALLKSGLDLVFKFRSVVVHLLSQAAAVRLAVPAFVAMVVCATSIPDRSAVVGEVPRAQVLNLEPATSFAQPRAASKLLPVINQASKQGEPNSLPAVSTAAAKPTIPIEKLAPVVDARMDTDHDLPLVQQEMNRYRDRVPKDRYQAQMQSILDDTRGCPSQSARCALTVGKRGSH